ncbi:MAG: rRNA synthase [Solirubrobacteraceae bacterium]|nr:rRNA synthase [Solirubrobacteraceae bacterium]
MRLGKYLAHAGVASRRGAEELVFAGRVSVGGQVVRDPARDVDDTSGVAVDGAPLEGGKRHRLVYAVNKPLGVVSTAHDPHGRPTVVDLVGSEERLYPVGRLDIDTSGLILLTNDGELANQLTHPRYGVTKLYVVTVTNGPVSRARLDRMAAGIQLDDGPTAPARVKKIAPDRFELELREGRKRQVRRMTEAIGYHVRSLERVQLGPLRLDRLAEGGHRRLKQQEIEALRAAAAR